MRKTPARRGRGRPAPAGEPWQVRVAVDGPQPHQHRDDEKLHNQDATVRRCSTAATARPAGPTRCSLRSRRSRGAGRTRPAARSVAATVASDSRDPRSPRGRAAQPRTPARSARPPRLTPRRRGTQSTRDTERRVTPVGRMTGKAHRQRDCERDEQAEHAGRVAHARRRNNTSPSKTRPRRQDRAEVSLCHDVPGRRRWRRREGRAAYGLRGGRDRRR